MKSQDLEAALKKAADEALAGAPERLGDAARYALLGGGKRFRARLALASAEALGLAPEAAIGAAAALEMIHAFTLVHDDLPCLDDDDVRRGQPSCHKKFDEATALLAGDALLAMGLATLLAATPQTGAEKAAAATARLLEDAGPAGVIGGQARELSLDASASLAELEAVHSRKTGALFLSALLIPADLAGVLKSDARYKALESFGKALGTAFQIADDLEDPDMAGNERSWPPAHILRYLTRSEALARAREPLTRAIDVVERAFKTSAASELIAIAREVIQKAESAAANRKARA